MRILRYLILSGLLVTLMIGGCSKSPEERAQKAYSDGLEFLEKFQFENAEKSFAEIGSVNAADSRILLGRARLLEQKLQHLDAFNLYALATASEPGGPLGYRGMYEIQRRFGAFDDALATVDKMIKSTPAGPDNHLLLARAVLDASLPALALRVIDSAVKLGLPTGEGLWLKARAHHATRQFDQASARAQEALGSAPRTILWHTLAADYYEAAGKHDSAVSMQKEATRLGPKSFPVWLDYFDRANRLGDFAASREAMREITAMGGDSATIKGMQIEYLVGQDRHVEAGEVAFAINKYHKGGELASAYYRLLIASNIGNQMEVSDILNGVDYLMRSGTYEEQSKLFLNNFLMSRFMPFAIERDAVTFLDFMYGPITNRRAFRVMRASILQSAGNFAAHDSTMKVFNDFYATAPDWLTEIGTMYTLSHFKRFDTAADYFARALELDPGYAPACEGYLKLLIERRNNPELTRIMANRTELIDHYPHLGMLKAEALILSGNAAAAKVVLEPLLKIRAGNMRDLTTLLRACAERDDTDCADWVLAQAASVHPDNVDLLTQLAERRIDRGEIAEAEALVQDGLAKERTVELLVQQAKISFVSDKREGAFALMDSLVALYQYHPVLVRGYSRLLVENGIDFDRATNYARGAYMYSHYQYAYHMELIDAYYRAGRYDLAWNEASNATAAYPMRAQGYYWLARCSVAGGKPGAKEAFAKSIALGLGGDPLVDAQSQLARLP